MEIEEKNMIIIIALIIGTIVSVVGCGLTPDNANIYICLIVFLICFVIGQTINEDSDVSSNKVTNIIYLLVALVLTIVMSSFSKVDTGHTGILISFGKAESRTYDAGITFRPFWKKMIQIDNRIQKNGHDDEPMKLESYTKDGQVLILEYTVNYKISKENASRLYKEIGLSYFNTVLEPIIQESVKNELTKYTATEYHEKRAEYAKNVEKDIKEKFQEFYIELTSTAIENDHFKDEYENAIEAKQIALQNKLKAEQEAEQRKIEADAKAYVVEKEAEAEAKANELKQKTITDNLIRYEAVQKWNGQLPTVEGSSTPIISLK